MCHFITATLSPGADVATVRRLAQEHQLRWEPIQNKSVEAHLLKGESYYFTTWGMCDCGTAIGSRARRDFNSIEPDHERELKKLRGKGWSQAKLDRWLDERKAAFAKKQRTSEARGTERRAEAERWLGFLRAVLTTKAARSVGLLLHFYRGYVDTERITIAKRRPIAADELTIDALLEVPENVLCVFEGGGHKTKKA